MSFLPANFYVEIGFATKLNYQEFCNKFPDRAQSLNDIINRHYLAMKKECVQYTGRYKSDIYRVEESRKEELKRVRFQAQQCEYPMTQKTPIVIGSPDTLYDDQLIDVMNDMKLEHKEEIERLEDMNKFHEKYTQDLLKKVFGLEKENYFLTQLVVRLKAQINQDIVKLGKRKQ